MSETAKFTPGPWVWSVRNGGRVELHTPHSGWLIVMDFVRQGMQGGTLRLAEWEGDERLRMGGIMRPATKEMLATHPDAKLIEASPLLFNAAASVAEWLERRVVHYQQLGSHDVATDLAVKANQLRTALAKASPPC